MNHNLIKEKAEEKGFTLTLETETVLAFEKGELTLNFNSETNILISTPGNRKMYNFVTSETIDSVALFLIRKN